MKYSNNYYTIVPAAGFEQGIRVSAQERKRRYAELKKHFKQGADTPFKTQEDAYTAIQNAGLSANEYCVCETTNVYGLL